MGALPKVLHSELVRKYLEGLSEHTTTGLRNRVALELMYRAGLRVSEVCNLTPFHVDYLNSRFIYVQQGKNKHDRYVPIDKRLHDWCEQWDLKKEEKEIESEYFLCTMKGGQLDQRYIRAVCERLSKKTGIYIKKGRKQKPVNPHLLRHCYATELLDEDFNIREVQQLLGHKDISTTMIYTHVRPQSLARKIGQRKV